MKNKTDNEIVLDFLKVIVVCLTLITITYAITNKMARKICKNPGHTQTKKIAN